MIASFWRLIRYHLGTAAFGSLIIAIIQMIRLILAYVQYMVNKYKNKGGAASRAAAKVAECILCCLQCILDCFERFMKFINMNAYIETAIYGYNFCRAAMKAFQLLVSKNQNYFLFAKSIHTIPDCQRSSCCCYQLNRNICTLSWEDCRGHWIWCHLILYFESRNIFSATNIF